MLPSMATIPTTEPTTITAGDTVQWTKTLSDYPADAYALNYTLQPISGGTPLEVTAAASGTDHAVTISAATSAGYSSGDYRWFSFVSDLATSTQRFTLEHGSLSILPDPATFTTASDLRSHARTVLDAIEAVLEGRATSAQAEYSLNVAGNQTQIKYIQIADLLKLRSYYAAEVKREDQAEAIAKGMGSGNRILVRFNR